MHDKTRKEMFEQSKDVQDRIQAYARQFGNKAANLHELSLICPKNIPVFCPLSDENVQAHLDKYALQWRDLWKEFQTQQGDEKSAIRESAIPILQKLRELIITTFNQQPFEDPDFVKFLDTVKQKNATLMVRSTGEEDTVDGANPGGNESIAAVEPTVEAVSAAMGQVVASYFSEKSLKQRLLSLINDITKDAFMPVLLQQMVGEPKYGYKTSAAVIRSGVMYTSKGNTQIHVAPGHGDLVINGKGLFDTFWVTRKNIVYSEVAKKAYRLVPADDGLIMKKNPLILQNRASISEDVARRIAEWGHRFEACFGMPSDVEFIYDPNLDEIEFVQRRPIPDGEVKLVVPSSVPPASIPKLRKAIKQGDIQKLDAEVITPAGFAAKVITYPNQVLIFNTIEEALTQYLLQTNSPVKVVVVKNLAGTMSHEAALFNSKAIPVLQMVDASALNLWLESKNSILMIDPQRNQILNVTMICNPQNPEQDLNDQQYLEEGLFTHPIAPTTAAQVTMTKPFELSEINPDIPRGNDVATLIETLEAVDTTQSSQDAAIAALNNIQTIFSRLAKIYHKKMTFFPQALILCEEIKHSIEQSSPREEHLALVSRLKSFIYADAHPDIFSNSMKQIFQEELSRQAIDSDYFQNLSSDQQEYMTQFLKLNKMAFNQQTRERWTSFVMDCIKNDVSIQQLSFIVKWYVECRLESDLINIDLQEAMQASTSPEIVLKTLMENCVKANEEFASLKLGETKNIIHAWEQKIHEWSDPGKFNALWHDYENDMNQLLTTLQLKKPEVELVKMEFLPNEASYNQIPGTASRAIILTKDSVGFYNRVNQTLESKTIPMHEGDKIKDFKIVKNIVSGYNYSYYKVSIERSGGIDTHTHPVETTYSIYHSTNRKITPAQMLNKIQSDFAYIISLDHDYVYRVYFVDKINNVCTVNQDMQANDLFDMMERIASFKNKPFKTDEAYFIAPGDWLIISKNTNEYKRIHSDYSQTTQKVLINLARRLTDLMDNTIKSLIGSPNYLPNQQEQLVSRFSMLLKPYYQLMSNWILTLPPNQISEWFSYSQQFLTITNRRPEEAHYGVLWEIESALKHESQGPRELNASGEIAVAAARVGSGADFYRQFICKKSNVTFADLFSLIHQNILTTLSTDRQNIVKIPSTALPEALQPLIVLLSNNTTLDGHINAAFHLLGIIHHYPMLTLEYNMPMAHHSAQFRIEYHQQTEQITLHVNIFGGNWGDRMNNLKDILIMDGIILGFQVKKQPLFSEQTLSMDFTWEFPAGRLTEVSDFLYHSFLSYDDLMNRYKMKSVDLITRYHGINLPEGFINVTDKFDVSAFKPILDSLDRQKMVQKMPSIRTTQRSRFLSSTKIKNQDHEISTPKTTTPKPFGTNSENE